MSPPLPPLDWTARADRHVARVGVQVDAWLERRSHGKKHPVHDFLFTYYAFAPVRLRQWLPSWQESLVVDEALLEAHPWLRGKECVVNEGVLALDRSLIKDSTRRAAQFIVSLCDVILSRPPRLRCYGLHEWAMVLGMTPEQVRHHGWRLRLDPATLEDFVRSQSLCCTHYDAFRFFTPCAVPLNALAPTLDTRLENEQGGCLHANMDLYKWAFKLWPWCGSDLIADAFLLALDGRDLDMRASPYDLRDLGYEPVCIETEEGRAQYVREQQALAAKAVPVRERLRALAFSLA